DDTSPPPPQHAREGALGAAEGAGEVSSDDVGPVPFLHAHQEAVAAQPCVVGQDFDGTQRLLDLVEGPGDALGVRDVDAHDDRAGPERRRRSRALLVLPLPDGQPHALLGQGRHGGPTDPPAGAGDEAHAVLEVAHVSPTPRSPGTCPSSWPSSLPGSSLGETATSRTAPLALAG